MDIKDFKVGQTVYVELTGNAKRGLSQDELIEEWEIILVGRKYVHARKKGCLFHPVKFEKQYWNSEEKFVEYTDFCVNHILYPSLQDIKNSNEKRI